MITEVVTDEITRVYPGKGKGNDHQQTLVSRSIDELIDLLNQNAGFVVTWITLSTYFTDDRALGVTQAIFTRLSRPIPDRFKPVVNAR